MEGCIGKTHDSSAEFDCSEEQQMNVLSHLCLPVTKVKQLLSPDTRVLYIPMAAAFHPDTSNTAVKRRKSD
jgi:hypothetical protein